jgi:hypothetical protein
VINVLVVTTKVTSILVVTTSTHAKNYTCTLHKSTHIGHTCTHACTHAKNYTHILAIVRRELLVVYAKAPLYVCVNLPSCVLYLIEYVIL